MSALFRFLNAPHPPNTSYASAVRQSVYISVFVAVFLMAFQPFELGTITGRYRLLLIASYGLPCLAPDLVIGCGMVWWKRSRKEFVWKVWHAIAVIFVYLLAIGASNHLYDSLLTGYAINWAELLRMEGYTALVGFFPSVAMFVSARTVNTCRNETAAKDLNRSIENNALAESASGAASGTKLELVGGNKDEFFSADTGDICYIKSDGNYVEIVTAASGAKHTATLLRATLKDIESQLAGRADDVVRCHRSYLVNRRRIASAEGNAMGLTITLDRDGLQVPVSRSFVEEFRK
jgi:hypothetical protein